MHVICFSAPSASHPPHPFPSAKSPPTNDDYEESLQWASEARFKARLRLVLGELSDKAEFTPTFRLLLKIARGEFSKSDVPEVWSVVKMNLRILRSRFAELCSKVLCRLIEWSPLFASFVSWVSSCWSGFQIGQAISAVVLPLVQKAPVQISRASVVSAALMPSAVSLLSSGLMTLAPLVTDAISHDLIYRTNPCPGLPLFTTIPTFTWSLRRSLNPAPVLPSAPSSLGVHLTFLPPSVALRSSTTRYFVTPLSLIKATPVYILSTTFLATISAIVTWLSFPLRRVHKLLTSSVSSQLALRSLLPSLVLPIVTSLVLSTFQLVLVLLAGPTLPLTSLLSTLTQTGGQWFALVAWVLVLDWAMV